MVAVIDNCARDGHYWGIRIDKWRVRIVYMYTNFFAIICVTMSPLDLNVEFPVFVL